MHLPEEPLEQLAGLAEAAGDGGGREGLAAGLRRLGLTARRAVPSCTGVAVSVTRDGLPCTIGGRAVEADRPPPMGAARVPLDQGADARQLVMFAAGPGASCDLVSFLRALPDPLAGEVLGAHDLPQPADWRARLAVDLSRASAVNQAVGVLIDRGAMPGQARAVLELAAQRSDVDVPTVAQWLLYVVICTGSAGRAG